MPSCIINRYRVSHLLLTIVIKITEVCLNKSFATNLFSHIFDFSVINKKFIYLTLGIYPVVHFKRKISLRYPLKF